MSTENEIPTILDIVEGLSKISTFKGIHVEDEKVKRRSSVALILRFRGIEDYIPSIPTPTKHDLAGRDQNSSENVSGTLEESSIETSEVTDSTVLVSKKLQTLSGFLDFVKKAIQSSAAESKLAYPEILFIKRTARTGDRWSGHVALPGGKRDPTDTSDQFTAERETWEEVGLKLEENAYYVGPLDQRLVKTSWGRVTLMTLCPFIYVLKPHATLQSTQSPATFLKLQPTEIDRAFWIPVNELYEPKLAMGREQVSLGDRLRVHRSPFLPRRLVSALCKVNAFGDMLFGAIDLVHPKNLVISDPVNMTTFTYSSILHGKEQSEEKEEEDLTTEEYKTFEQNPYKLWGLTHGIIVDMLEVFEPFSAAKYFFFPTLTAPDIRFFIYILSYPYVQSKRAAFLKPGSKLQKGIFDKVATSSTSQDGEEQQQKLEQEKKLVEKSGYNEGQLDITGKALSGYFPFLARAIYLSLFARATLGAFAIFCLVKLLKFRRNQRV